MRRLGLLAAVVAGVTLVGGAVLASGQRLSQPVTITFIEKDDTFHVIDEPPTATGQNDLSLGDQFLFAGRLFQNGEVKGHVGGHCMVVHKKPNSLECEATATLPGGKVTLQTSFHFGRGAFSVEAAITGGTGNFRNARGYFTSKNISPNASRDTFYLIP